MHGCVCRAYTLSNPRIGHPIGLFKLPFFSPDRVALQSASASQSVSLRAVAARKQVGQCAAAHLALAQALAHRCGVCCADQYRQNVGVCRTGDVGRTASRGSRFCGRRSATQCQSRRRQKCAYLGQNGFFLGGNNSCLGQRSACSVGVEGHRSRGQWGNCAVRPSARSALPEGGGHRSHTSGAPGDRKTCRNLGHILDNAAEACFSRSYAQFSSPRSHQS